LTYGRRSRARPESADPRAVGARGQESRRARSDPRADDARRRVGRIRLRFRARLQGEAVRRRALRGRRARRAERGRRLRRKMVPADGTAAEVARRRRLRARQRSRGPRRGGVARRSHSGRAGDTGVARRRASRGLPRRRAAVQAHRLPYVERGTSGDLPPGPNAPDGARGAGRHLRARSCDPRRSAIARRVRRLSGSDGETDEPFSSRVFGLSTSAFRARR
jgi:hypothetical protein